MINAIEVRNFGCFGNSTHTLNLGPETFIVGPNNVGKSTFIAAYALVAQQGNWIYPLTKFSGWDAAIFAQRKEGEVNLTVRGDYGGNTAERTLKFDIQNRSLQHVGRGNASELIQQMQQTWFLTSDRLFIPINQRIESSNPVLDHRASNVIPFLLEKWTSRDQKWEEAETWIKKIDPSMTILKSPLRGQNASVETTRKYGDLEVDVNVSYQGGGIQRALQMVAAIVFSPEGTVIMTEEPEMNLHKETQEVMVDLFNKAVNEWDKQIIITTHSWDMILPIISDIGPGSTRGANHVKADAEKFRLARFALQNGAIAIEDYDITKKEFRQIKEDFKITWG